MKSNVQIFMIKKLNLLLLMIFKETSDSKDYITADIVRIGPQNVVGD